MFAEALRKQLPLLGVDLSDKQIDQLEHHFELLVRWNKVINLTRLTRLDEAIQFHYCESLFLGSRLPHGKLRLIDVGSGGGFPGVPVAILRPECSVTLVDANQRKSAFLQEATRQLPNCSVLAKRVEQLGETFEWAIMRAVSYESVSSSLITLAPNLALLGGPEQPDNRFTWNKFKVPWGESRFLWLRSST